MVISNYSVNFLQLTFKFLSSHQLGTIVEDQESGIVIQLQGDQRKLVYDFLVDEKIVKKEAIKIHGF
jgi:translation initiation factor SUI1